jgi:Helix-turn-helix domain
MRVAIGGNTLDELLTEVQAADFLRLSVRTLQAWRARKFGPAFVRAGRAIRYRRRDLIAWIEANTTSPCRISTAVA